MPSSVNVGNAGEHLVMAVLLEQGFHAAMADRGNPAFDILTLYEGVSSAIRVKTSRNSSVQYTAKSHETIFLDINKHYKRDFVAFVLLGGSVPEADFYIVPTTVVDAELRQAHNHWHKYPKKDGSPRKMTPHRAIRFSGSETETNIAAGFEKKWAKYKDAWDQLRK